MIMAKEVPAANAARKPATSETDRSGVPDYTEFDDRALVDLVRNQEEDETAALAAYSVLIERYRGKIYGLVYNMTSNKEDTEDLVQEVFVKAYASMVKFRGQSSFYTWVYRIAVNRSINFLRKRKRRQTLSLNNPDMAVERREEYLEMVSKDSPFRDATLSELQRKLNEAINTLSEKHKTVVVMHDIQGISHEKIADILDCSAGTVRSRLFYARQRLQAELSELKP